MLWRWFTTLAVLASLAFAQPLYSKLGEQAEFFVAHGVSARDLLLLCLWLSVIIPGVCGVLPLLARAVSPAVGRAVFYGLVFLLTGLITLPALALLGMGGYGALTAAAYIGALISLAWARMDFVRLLLVWLAPSILIFPLVFLLLSRASALVLPTQRVEVAGAASTSRHHVVMLVLDEFPLVSLLTPELEIDRERYPNFARLAELSHWFAGASSGAEGTVTAVPAALTGLPPADVQGKLPLASSFPDNLFTRLHPSHEIHARETATLLCPRDVCEAQERSASGNALAADLWVIWQHIVIPRPWADQLPPLANAWAGFGQPDTAAVAEGADPGLENALAIADWAEQQDWYRRYAQFQSFIESLKPGNRPALHYLHILLPHAPWSYLPSGQQYNYGDSSLAAGVFRDPDGMWRWTEDTWQVTQAWQQHLLQVQFLDGQIGQLLDRLETQGMWDDTLLVVVGDHGGAFLAGEPRRELTQNTLTDITAVPLFIRLPGQHSGVRHDVDARLEDIVPTVLSALGQASPDSSLLAAAPRPNRGPIEVWGRRGLVLSYTHQEHMEHLAERARTKAELLGVGDSPRFYDIGPEPGLLGAPVSAQPAGAATGEVEFEGLDLFRNVDPSAPFIPRLIRGRVSPAKETSRQAIAISVNDLIQATTWAVGGQFTALLPPNALRPGSNDLRAYLIDGAGASRTLEEYHQHVRGSFTLEGSPDKPLIETEHGVVVPVTEEAAGTFTKIAPEGEGLFHLSGELPPALAPPVEVLAFQAGTLVGVQRIGGDGRSFSIPVRETQDSGKFRVFAVASDRSFAVELGYSESCQ
jgi:hypothetical protein